MTRFFCPILSDAPGRAELDEPQSSHARKVLRLSVGDRVELFDGKGGVAAAVIASVAKRITLTIERRWTAPPPQPTLDLAVALPKGSRAQDMAASLSQVGVDRLIPLRTERSVVDARDSKLDKLNIVAVESAKQCGRNHVMEVSATLDLDAALALRHDVRLFASPAPESIAADALTAQLRSAKCILILIGPEGGWSPPEAARAQEAGCIMWSFSTNILRIETAAIAAAAIVRHLCGSR